ncbi:hypothetical protein [Microlunatus sp. GCM10028923]|uniref:hypothetical protein n=1 Tax=Microlunatus sp. GCM10028923 TaxID=3273400 RepID=UPI00361E7667
MRKRRSSTPNSPSTGRILGVVGIAMIAMAVLGVIFVVVNRPSPATTAAQPASAPPATSLAELPASKAQTPMVNEHSHSSDDGPDDEPKQKETPSRAPSPSPTPQVSTQSRPPSQSTPPRPEQQVPPLRETNLPTSADLFWRTSGEWQEEPASDATGDRPPSVCLPSMTVLANPTTLLRRDYTLTGVGRSTAVAVDYPTEAEAETAYAELGRSVRECPALLRQQGYVQPSPVAVRPVPLPEGIVAEHLRLEYQFRKAKPTTESIGLLRAGNRVLMISMVTPASDTTWAEDPAGKPQDHPMLRTLPAAAIRLVG